MKNELQPVTIVTTTYYPNTEDGQERARAARTVIRSWSEYLYNQGSLKLHIADDGSELTHYKEELNCDGLVRPFGKAPTWSRQERKGVGASLNAGFKAAFERSPFAMYIVDDWRLDDHIDLTPWVQLLLDREDIGIIRLSPPHPDISGTVKYCPPVWVLDIDRHHYAYGMRPALYHERFFEKYGWFDEGKSAMECERMFNERYCDSPETEPRIVHAIFSPWTHRRILDLGEVEP